MTRNETDETVIRTRIGEVVRARRIVRGLGLEELAKAARIDLSQLMRVEEGKSGLSLYSLSRIAHALGWSLGELVYVAFPPTKARRGLRGDRVLAAIHNEHARESAKQGLSKRLHGRNIAPRSN